jgi:hypothetical protein
MKISHVNTKEQANFIEVRQYSDKIVNIPQSLKPTNSEFCNGVWKVKRVVEIPIEYKNDYVFLKKSE